MFRLVSTCSLRPVTINAALFSSLRRCSTTATTTTNKNKDAQEDKNAATASTSSNDTYGDDPFSFDDEPSSKSSSSSSSSSAQNRSAGTITKWVEDKGFGFVSLKGKSLFVHARELRLPKQSAAASPSIGGRLRSTPRLREGQEVEFTIGAQPDGRLKATQVSSIGGKPLPILDGTEPVSSSGSNDSSDDANQAPEGKSKQQQQRFNSSNAAAAAKLFSAYQWSCVESGNTAMEGFKHTTFPTGGSNNKSKSAAAGNLDEGDAIPVPTDKWGAVEDDNNEKHHDSSTAASASASTSSSASDQQQQQHQQVPLPSSKNRPIWESELIGWPTELAANEMEFFDLQELEERRSNFFAR